MTVIERDRRIAHAWISGDVEGYLALTEGREPKAPEAPKATKGKRVFGKRGR